MTNTTITNHQKQQLKNSTLSEHVALTVKGYLQSQELKNCSNLYQIIMEEVEAPLLRTVMEHSRYNQSRAARVLGISRGTLRSLLKRYFEDEFIGSR